MAVEKKKEREKKEEKISADADGGPRSRVRTAGHSAQPPIDVSGNFPAHVSAESPSKFSKKLRNVIQIRQIH